MQSFGKRLVLQRTEKQTGSAKRGKDVSFQRKSRQNGRPEQLITPKYKFLPKYARKMDPVF